MLPNGLHARMLKSFERPSARAVARNFRKTWGEVHSRARRRARACRNQSNTYGFVAISKPSVKHICK
eukprot:7040572-Pyramimonas_sp.AAC.1